MNPKPMLNGGCGRIVMPRTKPPHHVLVDDAVYEPDVVWHNVDKFPGDGVDECLDLFTYPWPWEDNRFKGALFSHVIEHIPHEIRQSKTALDRSHLHIDTDSPPHWFEPQTPTRWKEIEQLGDGFYAFFSELWRVCEPGAVAHILCPFAWSLGAMMDPTHTRYIVPSTFSYLSPDPGAPFEKDYGSHWRIMEEPRPMYHSDFNGAINMGNMSLINHAFEHQINVVSEFYIKLEAVKDGSHD